DERAEVRDARDAARAHLSDLEARGRRAPRILEQLFKTQRDLARRLVHSQYFDRDVVAHSDDGVCAWYSRPAHVGYMEQPLYAATEIHEGAVVEDRSDASHHHCAGDNRPANGLRVHALLLLELLAPRHHEGVPAISVLDDPEGVGLAFVHGGIDRTD